MFFIVLSANGKTMKDTYDLIPLLVYVMILTSKIKLKHQVLHQPKQR